MLAKCDDSCADLYQLKTGWDWTGRFRCEDPSPLIGPFRCRVVVLSPSFDVACWDPIGKFMEQKIMMHTDQLSPSQHH